MRLNDASKVIDIIDGRVKANTRSGAGIEHTYGTVAALAGAYVSAYLYGGPYASQNFRETIWAVNVNDAVRVNMDRRGDRWIEEVVPSTPYYPMQFDITGGRVLWGDTTTGAKDVILSRSAANVLRIDGDIHAVTTNGLTVYGTGGYALRDYLTTSDANPAVAISSTGIITWGPGGASATDTDLYRNAVNELKTTHQFTVGGDLTVTGSTNGIVNTLGGYHSPVAHQFLNAGGGAQNIKANGLYVGGSYADPNPNTAGLQFGPDVALYRDTAGRVTLSGSLNIQNTSGTVPYIYISGVSNTSIPGNPVIYFDQGGGSTGQTVLMYRVSGVNKAFTRVDNAGNFVISPQGGNTYLSWDNGGAIMLGQGVGQYVKAPGMASNSTFRGGSGDTVNIASAGTYYTTPNNGSILFTPSWVGQPWLIIATCAIGGNNSSGYTLMKTSVQSGGTDVAVIGYGRCANNLTTTATAAGIWAATGTGTYSAISTFTSGTTGNITVDYHSILAIPLMS